MNSWHWNTKTWWVSIFFPFGPVRCFSFTMHKTTDGEYKVKAIRSLWYARTQCACGHPCCTVRFKSSCKIPQSFAAHLLCHKCSRQINYKDKLEQILEILVDKESQRICKIYKRYSYTYVCPVIMNLWSVNGVTSSLQRQRKRNT